MDIPNYCGRFAQKVMGPKVTGIPTLGISRQNDIWVLVL